MNVTNPQQVIDDFERLLCELTENRELSLVITEKAVNICALALLDLRDIVLARGFETREEEIHFFKHQKPRIYSKFIYYGKLFRIICRRPVSTAEIQKKYFYQILESIDKYYNDNIEFFQYHKRGLSFLDDKFYTRDNTEIPPNLDNLHFLIDKSFTTMQDYTISTLMAHELLTEYIKTELDKIDQPELSQVSEDSRIESVLTWTESKTAMTELIYALHSSGAINNGAVDIKELAGVFEKAFNISLGDFYRIFVELRNRKVDRTKFLDTLKRSLLNRMDDADAK